MALRVLLAWELGDGVGYAEWLITIARALARRGCEPVIALRNIETTAALYADDSFPVIPAPYTEGRLRPDYNAKVFAPTSFADLMAANGFGTVEHLATMVRPWQDLLDLTRPDVVVGTYCPILGLACYGGPPLVLIGHSYTMPPADQPYFPSFNKNRAPYADQDALLTIVQQVQTARGRPVPRHLTDFYRGAARFVFTFRELDVYGELRPDTNAGPLETLGEIPAPAPEPRFHAYLTGKAKNAKRILDGLYASGLPGDIYMRDTAFDPAREFAARNIRWLDKAPPLTEAVANATVIVHHGGAGTTHHALASGRLQLFVPRVVDQRLSAKLVLTIGLGALARDSAKADKIAGGIHNVGTDRAWAEKAVAYAQEIRARGQHGCLDRLVETCLELGAS